MCIHIDYFQADEVAGNKQLLALNKVNSLSDTNQIEGVIYASTRQRSLVNIQQAW